MADNSYINLNVWKKSVDLAEEIYLLTKSFPKNELYGLTSQIRRSAVSVSSNIAEGCARNGNKEFLQFLGIASGSLAEMNTQLIIALRVQLIDKNTFDKIIILSNDIGKMLTGLKKSLRTKDN